MSAESIAAALGRSTPKAGGGFMACCPAHKDKNPSLAIDEKNDNLLLKCFAGCSQEAVIDALKSRGLWPGAERTHTSTSTAPRTASTQQIWTPILPVPADAPAPPLKHHRHGEPSGVWHYKSTDSDLLHLVCRFDTPDGKQVLPLTYCTNGTRKEWRWQALPDHRPLYGLETIGNADRVLIVEGEKTADAARRMLSTKFRSYPPVLTWSGGSNAVRKTDWSPLAGKNITIWPDADDPGMKAALVLIEVLEAIGCTVKVVEPPADVAKGWDLANAELEGWTRQQTLDFLAGSITAAEYREKHKAAAPAEESFGSNDTEPERKLSLAEKLRPGSYYASLVLQINWIIQGFIPELAVILLFGRGGMGKTTLLMQIFGAVAKGLELFGIQTSKKTVIYVDYENSLPVLAERCRNIDTSGILFLDSTSKPPQLDRPEKAQYLELLEAHPGAVIIFDTLKSSHSGAENDSQDMSAVMGFLRELRDAGATVIILHHTPKGNSRQYKGSGAIFDLCDHVLALYPVKKPGDESEVEDDDDADLTYRFGTSQKTRYEPARMFLSFDSESRRFVTAQDPDTQHIETIKLAMQRLDLKGTIINQKSLLDELSGKIPQKKVCSLLMTGTGIHWKAEKGSHNANIYTPIEEGNSVPQFRTPIYPCQTAELNLEQSTEASNLAKLDKIDARQTPIVTEFGSSSNLFCQTAELENPQTVIKLEDSDILFEGGNDAR